MCFFNLRSLSPHSKKVFGWILTGAGPFSAKSACLSSRQCPWTRHWLRSLYVYPYIVSSQYQILCNLDSNAVNRLYLDGCFPWTNSLTVDWWIGWHCFYIVPLSWEISVVVPHLCTSESAPPCQGKMYWWPHWMLHIFSHFWNMLTNWMFCVFSDTIYINCILKKLLILLILHIVIYAYQFISYGKVFLNSSSMLSVRHATNLTLRIIGSPLFGLWMPPVSTTHFNVLWKAQCPLWNKTEKEKTVNIFTQRPTSVVLM